MLKRIYKSVLICAVILVEVKQSRSENWEHIRCSSDSEQSLSDGTLADMGRFPWLGVVQHTFYVGGMTRFAITTGVLVHPAYAIAPAYDMARIDHELVLNNTKLLMWYSRELKYPILIGDYILHPEYEERSTFATVALLSLVMEGQTSFGLNPKPVLPVCLPLSGGGTLTAMYAVRVTDENKKIGKEVYKMKYVNDKECEDFYSKNKLKFPKLSPLVPLCATTERPMPPCVWDGGVALITRQNWGFWKIIGFSVRGPGCGAPARFLVIHDYLSWIDDVISEPNVGDDVYRIGARRFSPIKLTLFKASTLIPKEQGFCDRKKRGGVVYKDSVEVTATKDFGQGFFYVVITDLAQFNCAVVVMQDIVFRSNTGMWIEHYCYRELTGLSPGQHKPRSYRKQECFMYFKSAAFIMFRFVFSFKTTIDLTLYGTTNQPRIFPNPFIVEQTTDKWIPTDKIMRWSEFLPIDSYRWYM